MIDAREAKVGLHVFYQQPHIAHPEYGVITRIQLWPEVREKGGLIHVRFFGDTTAKACYPRDLYWPPDFCARDGANPPGQVFGTDYPRN